MHLMILQIYNGMKKLRPFPLDIANFLRSIWYLISGLALLWFRHESNHDQNQVFTWIQIFCHWQNTWIQVKTWTRQIWGIWKLRPAYSPETPNLGQKRWCFVPCDLEIWWMTVSSFVQHFIAIGEFKLELQSGNDQSGSNSTIFRAVWPCNLTYDLQKQ